MKSYRRGFPQRKLSYDPTRPPKPKADTSGGIWITVGADCPWNTTPGVRQVHHFKNREEARKAGFT